MKILVEPDIFAYGRCGMTRYYAAVCEGLKQRGIAVDLPLLFSRNDYRPGIARISERASRLPGCGRLLTKASRRLFQAKLKRGQYDLVIVTSAVFSNDFLRVRPDAPFVMIVHDTMRCVVAPDGLWDSCGDAFLKLSYLATRAAALICVSEATRRDLITTTRVPASRTHVLLSGNMLMASNAKPTLSLPERFVLFVGERSGRKQFNALVRVLFPILAERPGLHLVCTGSLTEWEIDYLRLYGIGGRVLAVKASDAVLGELYRRALCLIYPSVYEGFGLPVLEAMAAGCPVISSNGSSIPEVAGDAAILVNPGDSDGLAFEICRVVDTDALRRDLSHRGLARSRIFSQEAMMAKLTEILQSAAVSGPTPR
jgi:glycosyltransferase involved in cell wall biosynthesis